MEVMKKCAVIAIIILIYYLTYPSPKIYNTICLGFILLFGVPHGAADHRINATIAKNPSVTLFIITYLFIAIAYLLWWIFMPVKALIIFFIISSYHFGQEFLEEIDLSNSKVWEIMIWGTTILVAPILISYNEVRSFLVIVSKDKLPEIPIIVTVLLVSLLIASALGHLSLLKIRGRISAFQLKVLLLNLFILIISFILLPYVMAFTLYFVLFHSWNAFKHQYLWLKNKSNRYTIRSFLQDLLLFSALSISSIIIFIVLIAPEDLEELITYFFILISLVTLPHSILFDRFYKFKQKWLSENNSSF